MEDSRIVELYWTRSETAIWESQKKYSAYCGSIAANILGDPGSTEESLNDTWLAAWNSIPPHRPAVLSAYLGKLTRRIALHRWEQSHAWKRGGGQPNLALEELAECLDPMQNVESRVEARELEAAMDRFVQNLPTTSRRIFLRRYWYLDSIGDIAVRYEYSESKVKSILHRTRQKLREFLKKEGYLE